MQNKCLKTFNFAQHVLLIQQFNMSKHKSSFANLDFFGRKNAFSREQALYVTAQHSPDPDVWTHSMFKSSRNYP